MKGPDSTSTVADVRQRGCGHRVAYPATANLNELPDSVHSLCPRFRLQPELDQAADGFTDDGARLPAPATWWRVGLTQRCYSPFTETEGPPGRKARQICRSQVTGRCKSLRRLAHR